MTDFQTLEVVGRGSETQLQVAENLNCIYIYTLALEGLNSGKSWLNIDRASEI